MSGVVDYKNPHWEAPEPAVDGKYSIKVYTRGQDWHVDELSAEQFSAVYREYHHGSPGTVLSFTASRLGWVTPLQKVSIRRDDITSLVDDTLYKAEREARNEEQRQQWMRDNPQFRPYDDEFLRETARDRQRRLMEQTAEPAYVEPEPRKRWWQR